MKIKVGLDSVELGQAALGEAPEGFDAVDVSAAVGERLLLVDAHVLVVADIDQAIVTGGQPSEQRTLCGSIRPRMMARRV